MARVVILGAGISGHTAALHLKRRLKREHEVVVVSPNSDWNWIPSNIWLRTGPSCSCTTCSSTKRRPGRLVSHPRVSQATDISATRKVQSDRMTLQPEPCLSG